MRQCFLGGLPLGVVGHRCGSGTAAMANTGLGLGPQVTNGLQRRGVEYTSVSKTRRRR